MASDRLQRVLRSEHRVSRAEIAGLTEVDLRELEAAVTGKGDRRYYQRAVDALVSARGAGATRALAQVIANPEEPDTLRASAASQLGRVGPTAERPLLSALDSADSVVLTAAVGALARVGSPRSIEPLGPIADRDDLIGQQARLARTLIAFRAATSGYEPRPAAELSTLAVPDEGRITAASRRLRRDEAAAALADLRQEGIALSTAPEGVVGLQCGRERLAIALDAPMRAVDRPAVVGAVARRAEPDGSHSLSWYVLAWPAEGSIQVAVFRASGHQVLAGTASVDRAGASFELATVEGRGNVPAEVRGTVRGERLVELDAVSALRGAASAQPSSE